MFCQHPLHPENFLPCNELAFGIIHEHVFTCKPFPAALQNQHQSLMGPSLEQSCVGQGSKLKLIEFPLAETLLCAIAWVWTHYLTMPLTDQYYFRAWCGVSQHIPALHLLMLGLPYTSTSWVGVNPGHSSSGQSWGRPSLQAHPDPCSEAQRGQCCGELSHFWCWGKMCCPEPWILIHPHP